KITESCDAQNPFALRSGLAGKSSRKARVQGRVFQMGAVSVWSRRSFITFGLPLSSAVYVVCGGVISLLGWILHIPRLTDWYGDGIVIKANAAICVTAAGVGLLVLVL